MASDLIGERSAVSLYTNDDVILSLAHVVICTWEADGSLNVFMEGGNTFLFEVTHRAEAVDFARALSLFHETRSAQK